MATSNAAEVNFARVNKAIIDIFTKIYRDVLSKHISYHDIKRCFHSKGKNTRLRAEQISLINNAYAAGYGEFDITLMYTLLRNLCPKIAAPRNGWDGKPSPSDQSIGDDIERIRQIRNEVSGHCSKASLSDQDFQFIWSNIKDICKRMQVHTAGNYEYELTCIETQAIDKDLEESYLEKMKKMDEDERQTGNELKEIMCNIDSKIGEITSIMKTKEKKKKTGMRKVFARFSISKKTDKVSDSHDLDEFVFGTFKSLIDFINEKWSIEEMSKVMDHIFNYCSSVEDSAIVCDLINRLKPKISRFASIDDADSRTIILKFSECLVQLYQTFKAKCTRISRGSILFEFQFISIEDCERFRKAVQEGNTKVIFLKLLHELLEMGIFPLSKSDIDIEIQDTTDTLDIKEPRNQGNVELELEEKNKVGTDTESYLKHFDGIMSETQNESSLQLDSEHFISCTFRTQGIPRLVSLYRSLLVHCAQSIELIPHLQDVIDEESCKEIAVIHFLEDVSMSMECLINHIELSEHPMKWERFVDALEKNGNKQVADILRGEKIPKDVFSKYRKILLSHNLDYFVKITPLDILSELHRRQLISDEDKTLIEGVQHAKGNISATLCLLDRVWRYQSHWYEEFFDILCEDFPYVVERVDKKFYEQWELKNKALIIHSSDSGNSPEDAVEISAKPGSHPSFQDNEIAGDMSSLASDNSFQSSKESDCDDGELMPPRSAVLAEFSSDSDDEKKAPTKSLTLRKYQIELSRAAFENKNCIILAPSGSGKTHIALEIIRNHRQNLKNIQQTIPKVAVIVDEDARAGQIKKICKDYFDWEIKVISKQSKKLEKMSRCLLRKDLLIVTAHTFAEALTNRDIRIPDFSLIIFEECQRIIGQHPYVDTMTFYLDLKLESHHGQLPQIVGLSSSLDSISAKTRENAVDGILNLMAKMDAEELCVVKENKAELARYVYAPEQDIIISSCREDSKFGGIIIAAMRIIETFVEALLCKETAVYNITKPLKYGSEDYSGWLLKCGEIVCEKTRGPLNSCIMHLDMYQRALIIYNETRMSDSVAFMKEEFTRCEKCERSEYSDRLKLIFEKILTSLQTFVEEPEANPKLSDLRQLLLRVFNENVDLGGIIIVKNRDVMKALYKWMEDTNDLKYLKPAIFLPCDQPEGSSEGMTMLEQMETIRAYKEGRHRMLITTSFIERTVEVKYCILISHLDTTIETAVLQAKEKVKRYIRKFWMIGSEGDKQAEDEELKLIRSKTINSVIKTLRERIQHDPQTYRKMTLILQRKAKAERDFAAKNKKVLDLQDGQFALRCKECCQFLCLTDDIRKFKNVHVCIGDDIYEHVIGNRSSHLKGKDSEWEDGTLLCRHCLSKLGKFLIFKNANIFVLKIEYYIIEDSKGRHDEQKKWESVSFEIQDINVHDLLQSTHGRNMDMI